MTVSRHPQITEELLSAYLDNEVTDEERSMIETAIATDPTVAWQVNSLRETIQLLQALPPLMLPRSFTMEATVTAIQNKEPVVATKSMAVAARNRTPVAQSAPDQQNHWWQWLQQIWQGGNLYLRNATAVAFAILIVLFASDQFAAPYQPTAGQTDATGQTVAKQTVVNAPEVIANRAITAITNTAVTVDSGVDTEVDTGIATGMATDPVATPGITSNSVPAEPLVATTESATALAYASESPAENATEAPAPTAAKMPMPPAPRIPQDDAEPLDGGSADAADQFAQPEAAASVSSLRMATDVAQAAAASDMQAPQTVPDSQEGNPAGTVLNGSPTPVPMTKSVITATIAITESVNTTVTPPITLSTVVTATEEQQPTAAEASGSNHEVQSETDITSSWLLWAQMITALFTIVLGSLWWRSRG